MHSTLDSILNKHQIHSSESRKLFIDCCTIQSHEKNTNIVIESKQNNFEYILLEGILHRYKLNEQNEMISTGFYLEESVITPHFARTKQGLSLFHMGSLTNIVLAKLPVKELDELRRTDSAIQLFGTRIVEQELADMFFSESIYRTLQAKERLLLFRKKYPDLENRIPHTSIASYLGITAVSFSRLRKQMMQNK